MNKFSIIYPYWFQGAPIVLDNCNIANTDYLVKLPHYAMKQPITITNSIFNSTGTIGMINYYDDRTGGSAGSAGPQSILTISNTSISLTKSLYVITGLSQTTVNNINIVSTNNTFTPSTLQLCDPSARLCPNITIKES